MKKVKIVTCGWKYIIYSYYPEVCTHKNVETNPCHNIRLSQTIYYKGKSVRYTDGYGIYSSFVTIAIYLHNMMVLNITVKKS